MRRRPQKSAVDKMKRKLPARKKEEVDDEEYGFLLVLSMWTVLVLVLVVCIFSIFYSRPPWETSAEKGSLPSDSISDFKRYREAWQSSSDLEFGAASQSDISFWERNAGVFENSGDSSRDFFACQVTPFPTGKTEIWNFYIPRISHLPLTVYTRSQRVVDISDMRNITTITNGDGCFSLEIKEKETDLWYIAQVEENCVYVHKIIKRWAISSRTFMLDNSYLIGEDEFPEGYGNNILAFHSADPVHFTLRQRHHPGKPWREQFIKRIEYFDDEESPRSLCFEFEIELYPDTGIGGVIVTVQDGCYFLRQAIDYSQIRDRSYLLYRLIQPEERVHAHAGSEMVEKDATLIWKSNDYAKNGKLFLKLGNHYLHVRQLRYSTNVQLSSQAMCMKLVIETGKEKFILFAQQYCDLINVDLSHSDAYVRFIQHASMNQ